METEAGLVNSPNVAALVAKAMKSNVTAGSTAVAASVPPNTQIVEIQYTSSSARRAQEGAQAYADAFLVFRASQANDNLQHQLNILAKQAKSAEDSLKKSSVAASSAKPPADAAAQVQLFTNRLANLQETIGQLQAQATDAGSVVTPATAPPAPTGISPLLLILGAACFALLAGVCLAVWRERNDDRVRVGSETGVAGLPFLAHIPSSASPAALSSRPQVGDVLTDAYRRARAGVTVVAPSPSVLAISLVHDLEGPGVSAEVATNLALSLVSAEHTVCLVDTTWDNDVVSQLLEISQQDGLSEVLLREEVGGLPLVERHGLSVLTAGRAPTRARGLYASAHFAQVIGQLRARFDYVILASPSSSTPDGDEVALAAEGVVLVLADQLTSHAQVFEVETRARQLGLSIVGVISVERSRGLGKGASSARRGSRRPVATEAWGRDDPTALAPAATGSSRTGR
jgi:Mrp family chromosome partitioning ATPase